MTPLWWSILLAAVGILGLLLAGSKRKIGWAIGFGAQILWVIFAVVTAQYGFILSAVVYAVVYARNWWVWRRAERPSMGQPERAQQPVARRIAPRTRTTPPQPPRDRKLAAHDIYDEIASGPAD